VRYAPAYFAFDPRTIVIEAEEAVAAAKTYFVELFSEQATLEEIWFDDQTHEWCVTLGVKRQPNPASIGMLALGHDPAHAYKVVGIRDTDGKPLSAKNRDGELVA